MVVELGGLGFVDIGRLICKERSGKEGGVFIIGAAGGDHKVLKEEGGKG